MRPNYAMQRLTLIAGVRQTASAVPIGSISGASNVKRFVSLWGRDVSGHRTH